MVTIFPWVTLTDDSGDVSLCTAQCEAQQLITTVSLYTVGKLFCSLINGKKTLVNVLIKHHVSDVILDVIHSQMGVVFTSFTSRFPLDVGYNPKLMFKV